ncbi:hypothetical protein RI367_007778 [Sorochytrium milnesiophthora]
MACEDTATELCVADLVELVTPHRLQQLSHKQLSNLCPRWGDGQSLIPHSNSGRSYNYKAGTPLVPLAQLNKSPAKRAHVQFCTTMCAGQWQQQCTKKACGTAARAPAPPPSTHNAPAKPATVHPAPPSKPTSNHRQQQQQHQTSRHMASSHSSVSRHSSSSSKRNRH